MISCNLKYICCQPVRRVGLYELLVRSVSGSPSIACATNSDPICYEEADGGRERDEEEEGNTGCLWALLDSVSSLGKMMRTLVEGDHVSHQTGYCTARQTNSDDYLQDL